MSTVSEQIELLEQNKAAIDLEILELRFAACLDSVREQENTIAELRTALAKANDTVLKERARGNMWKTYAQELD